MKASAISIQRNSVSLWSVVHLWLMFFCAWMIIDCLKKLWFSYFMFESHILYIYLINIFVCPFPVMKVTDRLAIYCIFHVSRILILDWCRNESRISCQFETNYVKINMADGVKRVLCRELHCIKWMRVSYQWVYCFCCVSSIYRRS